MSSLEVQTHWTPPTPGIIVTPTLPLRQSSPKEMRSALSLITDSDLAANAEHDIDILVPAVDDSKDDEETEVPHARFNTQPATAENTFLLNLNLDSENDRFYCGAMLSPLDATARGALDDTPTSTASVTRSTASSRPGSTWGSDYVVVTKDMSRPGLDEVASVERVIGRRPRGQCPPTWRHAIYVSSLVWPAQHTQNEECEDGTYDNPLLQVRSGNLWRCAFTRLRTCLRR